MSRRVNARKVSQMTEAEQYVVIERFASALLENMVEPNPEIDRLVAEKFWDLA